MDKIPSELGKKIYLNLIALQKTELCKQLLNSPSVLISNKYQNSIDLLNYHIQKGRRFCEQEKIFIECFIEHLLNEMPYLEFFTE